MKQILPLLFLLLLFFVFPSPSYSAIDFHISNFEKVNDYYSVDAQITGAATGSSYYVQAMFTKPDPSSYFGFTWSRTGEWFPYVSSPEPTYIKTNFPSLENGVTQKILLKPDFMSSKYTGPGEYYLKLKRYTGESTSGTYSDTLSITLSEVTPSPEPTPTSTPATPSLTTATPTVTNTPTSQPTSTPIKTNIPTKTPSPTPTPTKTPTPRPIASATPTKTITPSSSVIPAQAGIHQISQLSGSSSAQILGDSTTSGLVVEIVTPSVIARQSTLPTSFYKYTFIIGAILSALSGGWLYFRHKKD